MVKNKISKLSPKDKIIGYLIENKNPHSIMEISGATLIDYKNTYNIIENLQPEVISKERIGNTNPIQLKLIPHQEIYSVEKKRTEEFLLKNPKLKLIKEDIEEIKYPFMIVIVFGSFAKENNTSASDIDLCIISDNKDKTKQLIEMLNLLSLKIEIYEFTTQEFISMIEKRQNNLGNEVVKKNIIIYGIENYYTLISKWMKKE